MLSTLSLRAKILAGCAVPLVLLAVLGIVSYRSIMSLNESARWVEHTHKVIGAAEQILASAVDMETGMRGFLLAGKEEFLDPYKAGGQSFDEQVKALQQTVSDNPAQVKLLDEIRETIHNWKKNVTEPAIAMRRTVGDSSTMDAIAALVGEARGKVFFDQFREQIATFVEREASLMDDRQATALATSNNTKTTLVAGTAVASILTIIVALLLASSIINPLKAMFAGLRTMSSKELGGTTDTFNRVIEGMTESVTQVRDAAGQLASTSQVLSSGASEQAASLEEVSSSLEEMASMSRTNAENANQADSLVSAAHQAASDGNQTMSEIAEASNQISKIIKVIEEIAFQTNLLALNAAVEAARAGEHGKGFAVVADEVRNLALRAAEAARETTGLIENSVGKSQQGASAMQRIADGVGQVTSLINGIAKASQGQSQGVEQINAAFSQMDKATQQNASAAEESAAASEELASQAETANHLVDEMVKLVKGVNATRTTMRKAAPTPTTASATSRVTPGKPVPPAASSSAKSSPAQPPENFDFEVDDEQSRGFENF